MSTGYHRRFRSMPPAGTSISTDRRSETGRTDMAGKLEGKRFAFLATDGVEQVELVQPLEAVRNEGGAADIVSLEAGQLTAFNHLEQGDAIDVDVVVADADASDYDGLVLPGGVANPDF